MKTKYYQADVSSEKGRAAWAVSGLKTDELTWDDMHDLAAYIQVELMAYRNIVADPIITSAFPVKLIKTQRKSADWKGVSIAGTYFKEREAVTFENNGFIGFCGEMSGYNRIPIFEGFYKWLSNKIQTVRLAKAKEAQA